MYKSLSSSSDNLALDPYLGSAELQTSIKRFLVGKLSPGAMDLLSASSGAGIGNDSEEAAFQAAVPTDVLFFISQVNEIVSNHLKQYENLHSVREGIISDLRHDMKDVLAQTALNKGDFEQEQKDLSQKFEQKMNEQRNASENKRLALVGQTEVLRLDLEHTKEKLSGLKGYVEELERGRVQSHSTQASSAAASGW